MSTPVSLKSLHFILQHMNADRRFEIYNCCPSLRDFEKSVPLKIKSLNIMRDCVIVNDTKYKLGIIRKCKIGEAARFVAVINEIGGDPYEVDAYGIRDESDSFTVTPGDVVINQRGQQYVHNENIHIDWLERDIQDFEARIANERGRICTNLKTVRELESRIEDLRARIFEYQCHRDNIPSNYELFFQLTKSKTVDKNEQKIVQRYIHNKKYSVAMKQMTTVLFGGRSSPIHVTKFRFSCLKGAIRLPFGLKLHIEQLAFRADFIESVRVLAPILHELSYPLKEIEIDVLSHVESNNPIINTAELLRIRRIIQPDLQTISAITNPIVHIMMTEQRGHTLLFEGLVEHWIESQRPLGYEYIFDYDREPSFAFEMEDILTKLTGKSIDEENVIIPMSQIAQLKVSYGPFPDFAPLSDWAVKFLTETAEH